MVAWKRWVPPIQQPLLFLPKHKKHHSSSSSSSSPWGLAAFKTFSSSCGTIQTDYKLNSTISPLMNANEDTTTIYVSSLKSSSHLQFSLLLENLGDIEEILACTHAVSLEREILLHIERLGALQLFHASISRTLVVEEPIFRTGKKEERKLRRKRRRAASLKRISTVDSTGVHVISSKSSRSLIARKESEMSKAVKDIAELEKTRARLEGEIGQQIGYITWAEAAGVEQRTLQQRLQYGWCCRDKLIRSTHSLVVYFARNYRGMGISFDDLLQAGFIGVLKGAERFDDTKGYRFSTYVRYWIRKSMLALVSKHSKGILVPVTMEKVVKRVQKVGRSFYDEEGRYPQDDEMAEIIGVPIDKVRLARKCSRVGGSLDQETGSGHCTKLLDVLADTSIEGPQEMVTRKHMREDMFEMLEGLHPREKQVLILRYGLEDGRCKSLGEIGRLCHVTKEWIRKIEKQAFSKIRKDDNIQRELEPYLYL